MKIFKKTIAIITTAGTLMSSTTTFGKTIEMSLPDVDNSFKTYMSYTAITSKNSAQYDMQQKASTSDNGIRMYDGRYMIAVGTYYSTLCGEKLNIYLDNDHIIYCVTGDIKQDTHTDKSNRYVVSNGNIIEFIVDIGNIDSLAKKMGDMSYSPNLNGNIIKIEKITE